MSDQALVPEVVVGERLAAVTGDLRWKAAKASLVSGGRSNLTYRLTSGAGSLILRRPPAGALLPRAHDMSREARVQVALASSNVPVPDIVYVDDAGDLFGAPFYVMRDVQGHVIRDEVPAGFADTPDERADLTRSLVGTLGALHRVDPESVGLGGYGRPVGYLERQMRLWAGQSRRSSDEAHPLIEALATRLAATMPTSRRTSILHGDYRLDNCIVASGRPYRVAAVLDWEMSTLGDPMTDVGMLMFFWRQNGERQLQLTPSVSQLPGFPTRADVARWYAEEVAGPIDDLGWYQAFAHYKYAVIVQGVDYRVRAGAMGGQDFGDLRSEVTWIAEAGLDITEAN